MAEGSKEADRRAVKILLQAHWDSDGWRRPPVTDPADLSYAIDAGVMFPPAASTHDQAVAEALIAREAVSPLLVGRAFASSLPTRRLHLRSALGSLAAVLHLQPHEFRRWSGGECAVCGLCPRFEVDRNVFNFERFKWGGVRHLDISYAAFDLQQLQLVGDFEQPTSSGLEDILAALRTLPPDARPGNAADCLRPLLKSNDSERRVLIGILAVAGVLQPQRLPSMFDEYVSFEVRNDAHPGGRNDWQYPAFAWRGSDSVGRRATAFWWPRWQPRRGADRDHPHSDELGAGVTP